VLKRRGVARARLSPANVFFRVIVAGGLSLIAATLVVGVFNWILSRLAGAGMGLSSAMNSTVLTYSYVVMFLFFFFSLFRSRLPLHRLLADLWQRSQGRAKVDVAAMAARPGRIKPKHERGSAESLREWEDLKIKRGDTDPAKPPEVLEVEPPAAAAAPPGAEPKAAAAETRAEAKAAIEAARVAAEAEKALAAKATAEAIRKRKQAEEAAAAAAAATLELERTILRRFASDVVRPIIGNGVPDDPVSRRGAALLLTGAATGLSATANIGPDASMGLLSDVLRHVGITEAAIDIFISQYFEQISAPSNQPLVSVGRSAIARYLQGTADVRPIVVAALAGWRTPFGQPTEPAFDAVVPPLIDVYVLTELRLDPAPTNGPRAEAQELAKDIAMGQHNGVVRTILSEHGGHEVKHTGVGIFARFGAADAAMAAASEMQDRLLATGLKVAIGVIGNINASEDPMLTPDLFHRAQTLTAQAAPGEVSSEPQVHEAALRKAGDPFAAPQPLPEPPFDAHSAMVA
jgi:hypothetical protein